MNNREEIQDLVELYIEAMNNDEVDTIPLTDDVEFRGAMLSEPIVGEVAVREHLRQIAPFFNTRLIYLIIENDTAAAMMDIEMVNGTNHQGAAFFRVRGGKICYDQAFFDTHRLFKGGS